MRPAPVRLSQTFVCCGQRPILSNMRPYRRLVSDLIGGLPAAAIGTEDAAMSEETFWIVQFRFRRDHSWDIMPLTISIRRSDAIRKYRKVTGNNWNGKRHAGLVRCIKVRIAPAPGL